VALNTVNILFIPHSLLVVLGGPDSANDKTPNILTELEFIRLWIEADRPYLGICLGLQLMVKAGGGKVVRAASKELGFLDPSGANYQIELTEEGRKDALFKDIPDIIPVFQLHGETVELTGDMHLLASGRYCRNQAVRYKKNVYGIQCHMEATKDLLAAWVREDPDLAGFREGEILEYYMKISRAYEETGRAFLSNFLDSALTARAGVK
jgi:GMP synthase (glutamine-hydrolysing)